MKIDGWERETSIFAGQMARFIFVFIVVIAQIRLGAQVFRGQVFMKEDAQVFLNHIYVTNLSTHKTVLTNYNGEFSLSVKAGDKVRFTSIISERKDISVSQEMLNNSHNFIELKRAYIEIPEVVIRFKPTGNLHADVAKLKAAEKTLEVRKVIGLPEPKLSGEQTSDPLAFAGGGLSLNLNAIYDLISGEQKKKERLHEYEKMTRNISAVRKYFGDEYFTRLKIPVNMIDNFLQFIYSSDNIAHYIESKNLESIAIYIEKYQPIYLKRLQNSKIMSLENSKG
ncbi:hypothetical protein [Bergeyella cardium]|uniref:hypothetical protein n=1 Tax=Bergeyella cardium TaxID=1585976 RepID=UPI001FE7B250|nr:hypothetical protein [Bergeyella cardium]